MTASEARIRANQANALKSTGPRTEEGKAASRANSYKHGMTGEGVVVPPEESAEVEALAGRLIVEMKPADDLGRLLLERTATLAVRMERCARREEVAVAANVARAMEEFVPPEGVDDREADRLRHRAGNLASFDDSKEAQLARRYEAAAERGFFRALKEFRQGQKQAKAVEATDPAKLAREALASSCQALDEFARAKGGRPSPAPVAPIPTPLPASVASIPASPAWFPGDLGVTEVPISIGRRR